MKANSVTIDQSTAPSGVNFSPAFNLCGLFCDKHIEEGRGAKVLARGRTWTLTFAELHESVCRFANALMSLGVQPGDRVMLLAKDTPAFYTAFLGIIRIGAVVVPINTFLRSSDYGYMLSDSKAVAVIAADGPIDEIRVALEESNGSIKHRIAIDGSPPGWIPFKELLAGASIECPIAETTANSPCFWLYSSGSTGAPKASVHEHKDMVYTSQYYAVETIGIGENDVIFSAPKLFFAYGIGNSFSFPLYVGCEAILFEDRPTAENTLDMIEHFKPTVYFSVPTLYAAQVAAIEAGRKVEMGRTRICLSGGEPLPPAVMKRWNRLTGIGVFDGIGSSEGLHIYAQNLPNKLKEGSAGTAVTGYRMRVVDPDGNEVPDGTPGELVLYGESFAKFYWNKPEKTAATWTEDGGFRSGDTVFRDKDGFFFFCGRGDDMLKVGGIWVAPFEVESALTSHPDVIESAVVGAPDKDGLIKPKAFCVLRDRSKANSQMAETLIQFTKDKLAPYKYPRWVEFVDELPKTASGKIQRFRLRA